MRKSLPMLLILGLTTSFAWAGNGGVTSTTPGPIRFNISVLFQYAEADPLSWLPLFEEGSKLLYDATEKQIQLGNVTIYVNRPQMKAQADMLISDDPNKGASAHIFGFGYRGYHMFYSQVHKSVTGRVRGQMGFVHELGHYAFGMYDEYQGSETRATASDLPLLESAKKYFCIHPETGGVASIMDAGTATLNNVRTEFCYPGDHNYGRFQPSDEEGGLGRIYRNKQQVQRQRSCWEQLVAAMRTRRVTVTAPTSAPLSDISGHQPINVTVVNDVVPRTVLILDNSTPNLEALKKAASSSLDGLKDGTSVAVVSLGAPSTTVLNLTVLDVDSRNRAQEAIGNLTRAGAPELDAALRRSVSALAARTPRSGNENVLVVTGSNVSASQAVKGELRSGHVSVNYVSVGEVEVAPLQELAHDTGGAGQAVPSEEQLDQAVEEEARSNQGDTALDWVTRTLAPAESFSGSVAADTFLNELSFELEGNFALAVTDPQGRPLTPSVVDPEGVVYQVSAPQVGLYRYTVTAQGSVPAEFELGIFGTDLTTGVEAGGEEQVAFPQAQRFQVAVFAEDGGVQGAAVNGSVIRPDGSSRSLTLYDDGSDGHGDDEAHDGVYSNYFGGFQGPGIYALDALARNVDGRTAVTDDPGLGEETQPVAPFQRLSSFGFEVNDVPATVGTGSLSVRPLGPNRWSCTAGASEGVLVTQVMAPLSGVGEGVLLVDEDESVRVPLSGGQATFADPVFVEAGQTRVVEIDAERVSPPAVTLAPFAWLAAGLAGFFWAARRQPRRAPAWAGVTLLGLLVVSCGGGEDFVGGSPAAPQLQVVARGATSERPILVDVQ